MNITDLMNIFNGSVLVEAGHQEWGYITEPWHLALPGDCNPDVPKDQELRGAVAYWRKMHIGESIFTEENEKNGLCSRELFIKANYSLLITAGCSTQHALLITFMRVAMAQLGAIALDIRERHVSVDEYSYVTPPEKNWEKVTLPLIERHREIVGWVKKFAGVIVSHIVFLFVARGHHYLPEFNEIYQKLYKSSFISDPVGFVLPVPEMLYRLSMHCFGVAPLLDAVYYMKNKNQMAAAMMIRYSPHPPIAGVAQFTTMMAAFDDMRRHSLFGKILDHVQGPLADLTELCRAIHAAPFRYHVASMVLTGQARIIPDKKYYDMFTMLAPIALGYIDYLGRKHSLAGQKAITQKYGGSDPAVDMWSRAFDEYGPPSAKDYDVNGFFAALGKDKDRDDTARRNRWLKTQVELDTALLNRKHKELEVQELEIKITGNAPTFQLPVPPKD